MFLDGRELVAVEVKSARRAGPRFRPADRVSPEAARRLERAARWLARRAGLERARIDVVEVVAAPGTRPKLRWHRDFAAARRAGREGRPARELPYQG